MRHSSNVLLLLPLLSLAGCTADKTPAEPAYFGKVEVLQGKKVTASRDYSYKLRDLTVAPDPLDGFRVVQKGVEVGRLKVYWPTYGLEKPVQEAVQGKATVSMSITSEYKLINNGGRYSLLERGFDDAEYYGFNAASDKEAVGIALDYVVRFVVPRQIGHMVYEFKQLEAKDHRGGEK
ncbi:MAG: hypothetical protein ACLQLG_17585 [Thermoguttaceae bacterium]